MSLGKRHNTSEPLTEHDVAERLSRSAMRTLGILYEAREMGIMKEVKGSRYMLSGLLELLAEEIEKWER